jgi:hypothetical protein
VKDLKLQLEEGLKRHAESAADRFEAAHSPLLTAAWDAVSAKVSQRPAKASGQKFWLPERDTELIRSLMLKADAAGLHSNRSQVVRAGVHLLAQLTDAEFKALMEAEGVDDDEQRTRRR